MIRSHPRRALLTGGGLAAATAAVLTVVVLRALDLDAGGPGTSSDPVDIGPVQRVALQNFDSCDALLRYYRAGAEQVVGPYGLPGQFSGIAVAAGAAESQRAAGPGAPGTSAADGSTSATGTNIQVAGVDEADVAKLSGGLLLAISEGALRVSTVEGGAGGSKVTAAGTLRPPDWSPQQLLVSGDRALLTGILNPGPVTKDGREDMSFAPTWSPRSRLAEVDLSDPAKPRVVRTLDVTGSVVGARLVDGVARLAITSPPGALRFTTPHQLPGGAINRDGAPSEATLDRAVRQNRKVVRAAGLDTWLPTYTLTSYDAAGKVAGSPSQGRLLDCEQVAAPKQFAGIDTVSLLTFQLGSGLQDRTTAGVVATGSSIYATAEHTYVTTAPWTAWRAWQQWSGVPGMTRPTGPRQPERTAVHLFTTTSTAASYVASGEVPGYVHDQFALDEHDGRLRVATTSSDAQAPNPAGDGGAKSGPDDAVSDRALPPQPRSESQVTVLERQGDRLVQIGSVGGLGKTETIRSVRFMGDVGYVVTFRQTDPLYTIDLSDPGRPVVAGELKILGYSAYLHPAGPGRLLGVGQDADAGGRVTGLQLSLFDVSKPAAPRRLTAVELPGAWSDVEGDHHAFTFAGGLALVPYGDGTAAGVVAVRASDSSLSEPRTLLPRPAAANSRPAPPDESQPWPMRTFIRDGVIYTVTTSGIATHNVASLAWSGFTAYSG